jgi:hypothetical protein
MPSVKVPMRQAISSISACFAAGGWLASELQAGSSPFVQCLLQRDLLRSMHQRRAVGGQCRTSLPAFP